MLPQIEVPPHQITTFVRMVLGILNEYARNWTSDGDIPLTGMISDDNSATDAAPIDANTYMRQQCPPNITARVAAGAFRIPEAFPEFDNDIQADISAAFHQTQFGNDTMDSTYHTQTSDPSSYRVTNLEINASQQNTAAEMATFSSLNYSNVNRVEQEGQDPFHLMD